YGHYVKGNTLDLNLLRSPQDTDKEADQHKHTFIYAYYPHEGSLIESVVLKEAHLLNSPLIIRPIAELPSEKQKSFFRVEGDGVKIETVKPAEDGNGIILRLYETDGKSCSIRLEMWKDWQKLIETDMLENDEMEIELDRYFGELLFEPFEIRTFRVIF
nr:glycosyl hydrolase-related protein [Candidatus Cloacimonadota bacterium]